MLTGLLLLLIGAFLLGSITIITTVVLVAIIYGCLRGCTAVLRYANLIRLIPGKVVT